MQGMSETEKKLAGFTRRLRNQNTVEFRSTDQDNYTTLQVEINNLLDLYTVLESRVKDHTFTLAGHDAAIEELQKTIRNLPTVLASTLFDQINFNLTPASTTMAQGRMLWNSEYSTVMLGIDADVDLAIGQAMYKRIRNNTGSTIIKGQVLYVTGSHGAANITVGLADASTEATAATTIGIAAEDINDNTEGFIITQGYLKGINTNSLAGAEGAMLWLSETTGAMTTTRPTQPAHGVHLGWLVKKAGGGAGSIYVSITNGQELYELHDVLIQGPQDGQVLTYDGINQIWKNNFAGGAIAPNSVNTSIDFGSNTNETTAETTVTGQTWVTSNSNIQIRINPTQSHGHTTLDYLLESIQCMVTKINVGSGFVIKAYAPNGTSGIYDIIAYEI